MSILPPHKNIPDSFELYCIADSLQDSLTSHSIDDQDALLGAALLGPTILSIVITTVPLHHMKKALSLTKVQ